MKFAVGYQNYAYGETFPDIVKDYKDDICEVFFPAVAAISGRPPLMPQEYESVEEVQEEVNAELRKLHGYGIKLDLLLNANCYGDKAVSRTFEKEINDTIGMLTEAGCRPEIITTTSPFVARTVKKYHRDIETRASVNMRIGTVQAMGYVSELFDGYYIQRDRQRNLEYVKAVSRWCHQNGKRLCMLVNSGCLRFCPGQVFHDNLIAHCSGAMEDRVTDFNPHVCWNLFKDGNNMSEVLKSTWIRPEDIWRYDGIVDVFKLATRQHSHPRTVIASYVNRSWDGNLLDIMEPGYAPAFYPYIIDNKAFPDDFFENTGKCISGCSGCGYCEDVIKKVKKKSGLKQ